MAQYDYVQDDVSGGLFLSELNDAWLAVASQNSGPTEPSPSYPFMPWPDTTNNLFKMRNAANNAWVTLGSINDNVWIPYSNGQPIPTSFGTAAAKDIGNNTGQVAEVGPNNNFAASLLPIMGGAGAAQAGSAGIVPAPQAGQQGHVLYGGGFFGALPGITNQGDANSYILLPTSNGNVLIHWGSIIADNPPGFGTVNFSPAFSAAPGVACVAWTNAATRMTAVRSVTATAVTFQASDIQGGAVGGPVYWIAIGRG